MWPRPGTTLLLCDTSVCVHVAVSSGGTVTYTCMLKVSDRLCFTYTCRCTKHTYLPTCTLYTMLVHLPSTHRSRCIG